MEMEDLLQLDEEQLKSLITGYLGTISYMKRRASTIKDIAEIGKYTFEEHISLYELKNGDVRRVENEDLDD